MNTMSHITAGELNRHILTGNPPTIIDVRSSLEYRHGHVPGAIHMPFWKSLWMAEDLTAPREEPLVVYCAHGPRACLGRFALKHAGFRDIRYLDGHMTGWVSAGLPVEPGNI